MIEQDFIHCSRIESTDTIIKDNKSSMHKVVSDHEYVISNLI